MDLGRIFGAVLNGATQRPRGAPARPGRAAPARRGSGAFGLTQTETRQIGRAIGALAGIAAEALSKSGSQAPQPPPPARGKPAEGNYDAPERTAPAPSRPIEPARRVPEVQARPAPAPAPSAEAAEARLLIRAMIAAARADGTVDREERGAIARQLEAAGLTGDERDEVLKNFDRPATVEQLASEARDPMLRAQLYAAAFAAAGEISTAERAWLDRLAAGLKLDQAARAAIEKRLGG